MTRTEFIGTILPELTALYVRPFGTDEEQNRIALAAYADDLQDFTGSELEQGWRHVRRTHKGGGRPSIQMIRRACVEYRERANRFKPQEVTGPTQEQCFSSLQGQVALRSGYSWEFYIACDRAGRVIDQAQAILLAPIAAACRKRMLNDSDPRIRAKAKEHATLIADREKVLCEQFLRAEEVA